MDVKYFLCCIKLEVFAMALAILQLVFYFILSALLYGWVLQAILERGFNVGDKIALVIVIILSSILAFSIFMNIHLIRGVMRRDAGPVNCYIYYLLAYVTTMVFLVYIFVYQLAAPRRRNLMIYAVSTSIVAVALYCIVCLRSLKLKFQNEKLPIAVISQSRVEATYTQPLVAQPAMV